MANTTKVKTFTIVIPAGQGPTVTTAEESIQEMLWDLRDQMTDNNKPTEDELQAADQLIVNGFGVNDWHDGEYTFFEDYKLRIETMPQYKLDEMPEFAGY
ncbi:MULTISPECIES: hypothetical protein [unclassified Paenibacillus]|uniref:hypothetical protein n=1 Tax=unclassified Paenibacillus TaxID=185978 RepID=UPI00096EDDA3|nr:hypothetical protein [Paenibacillus sp. FSL H8-0259]OMF31203.1 hypothetical protein BK132_07245 [Paenibacillus sp. FSL H8-0259]